jgi:flavin reductase (DIM6/NTAB) family NADH-FMN oxidoreductase RutF
MLLMKSRIAERTMTSTGGIGEPGMTERIISADEVLGMERLVRMRLINGVSGMKSANLVGTVDGAGQANLALFNSVVHIGANPPCLGMVFRPLTVRRDSYENIKATGVYTINHVHAGIRERAHRTSASFPAGVSEFEACGLTPETSPALQAPYVAESRVKIGLVYEEEHTIRANGTILLVGRVLEIRLPNEIVGEDGYLDLAAAGSLALTGLEGYHEASPPIRLPYARPPAPRVPSDPQG